MVLLRKLGQEPRRKQERSDRVLQARQLEKYARLGVAVPELSTTLERKQ